MSLVTDELGDAVPNHHTIVHVHTCHVLLRCFCVCDCTAGGGSRGTSPSSPFDISKFDMFTSNISPVTTPPPKTERVMLYSKHSKENLQAQQAGQGGVVEGVESPLNESECVKLDLADLVRRQSTPKTASSGGNVNSEPPDNPLTAGEKVSTLMVGKGSFCW